MSGISCNLISAGLTLLMLSIAPCMVYALSSSPITKGFTVSPRGIALQWGSFSPFLSSPMGNFSLGFQQVSTNEYVLSIMYTVRASSSSELDKPPVNVEMVWSANIMSPCSGDASFVITEQGSLMLTDGEKQLLSTGIGETLELEDTGNLKFINGVGTAWQSFDNPTDTLLPGQNFTASMRLTASISNTALSGEYYLQMVEDGMALYSNLGENLPKMMYYKLYAREEKAQINPQEGPIYARVGNMGFLGMYQTEQARVSYYVFKTYNWTSITRRRMKLNGDGSLKVYYWDNDGSSWEVDYEFIQDECGLPYPCGPYGVCRNGQGCVCPTGEVLNKSSGSSTSISTSTSNVMFSAMNATDQNQGCVVLQPVDVGNAGCSQQRVYLRVEDVDTVFNGDENAMARANASSEADCEALCGANCSCTAFFYRNGSLHNCFLVHGAAISLQGSTGHVSYIKVTSPPLQSVTQSYGGQSVAIKIIVAIVCILFALGLITGYGYFYSRRQKASKEEKAALRKETSFDRSIELSYSQI